MTSLRLAEDFIALVDSAGSAEDLARVMAEITRKLGFQHFALSHHVDVIRAASAGLRLHNYPARWADYYDRRGLGVSDPVHRASHVTSVGFPWSRIPQMIPLTTLDREVLALGRAEGIGDGFTVPAHVPGEARGSCSFANESGRPLPISMLPLAQLAGAFAFEAARRLFVPRGYQVGPPSAQLTDRQRDCVMWAGRGKTDWEIGHILGVKEDTVKRHMKQALERFGAPKRTILVIRALFDGALTFDDLLAGGYSPFGE